MLALLKQRPQRPQPRRPAPPRRNGDALATLMMITEEEALTLRELPAVKLLWCVACEAYLVSFAPTFLYNVPAACAHLTLWRFVD